MYVCAYLAIPSVSANDNVKHVNSNNTDVFYQKKSEMHVKYIKIHVYEYTEWMFAINLPY